jgi:hypothetical protein
MLKFLGGGATFIQGGTSIPESRVGAHTIRGLLSGHEDKIQQLILVWTNKETYLRIILLFVGYSLHFQPFIVRYGFSSEIISSWNCHAALLVSIRLELVFWKPIIIISYKSYCDHTLHIHTYDLRPTSLVETNRAKPNKYMTIIIIIY